MISAVLPITSEQDETVARKTSGAESSVALRCCTGVAWSGKMR
jgi:hypothetical protein